MSQVLLRFMAQAVVRRALKMSKDTSGGDLNSNCDWTGYMQSEDVWKTLIGIEKGVGEIKGQVGRIEGTLPSLATREEVSQVIALHTSQCRKDRRDSSSIIPRPHREPGKPTDYTPVVVGVAKVLGALAALLTAAAGAWFASQ